MAKVKDRSTQLLTPVPAFVGKALLPEVALGAMTSGTLSSPTIDDLCSSIISMATQHMERGGAMSWFEHLPTLARIVQKATWNKCDASHAIVAVALLGGSQKFHGVGSCVGRPRGCDDVAQAERLGERRQFILFVIRFALSRICPCAQGTQIRPLVWLIAYSTASWTCWFKSWHQRPIAWVAWVAPNSCLLRARWVKLVLQKVGRTMHGPLWCWKHLDYFQILQWIRTLRWARPLSFWIVSWLGRYAGKETSLLGYSKK